MIYGTISITILNVDIWYTKQNTEIAEVWKKDNAQLFVVYKIHFK